MRNFLILLIVSFVTQSSAQEIKFESKVIDYGKIKRGSDGTRFFKFKNVGDAPLCISRASASSNAHMAIHPKKLIFPEETGEIEVLYDTNRPVIFSLPVVVSSNAKNKPRVVLTIKGMVID